MRNPHVECFYENEKNEREREGGKKNNLMREINDVITIHSTSIQIIN
jgi:hypothetical protein